MLAILVDMAIAQLNLVHAMRWQGRPGGRDGIQGRVRRVSGFADRWNWEPDKYVCRRWKERAGDEIEVNWLICIDAVVRCIMGCIAEGEAEGDRVDRRRDPSSATGEDGRAVTGLFVHIHPPHSLHPPQPANTPLPLPSGLTARPGARPASDPVAARVPDGVLPRNPFASGNFGSVFERSDPARALLTAVGEITQEVAAVWGGDEEVMRVRVCAVPLPRHRHPDHESSALGSLPAACTPDPDVVPAPPVRMLARHRVAGRGRVWWEGRAWERTQGLGGGYGEQDVGRDQEY
ncbi:hypothetical protein BC936DRAFT_140100 [Jimgerdemannia flammicorona]|uniref:Uncharacterized protein n=1 Tax=Jimgerdemannia flammicorona TaxID=994334 RepID=A0A433B270_9FUNG|nr:hypothetical protein BC936DRAFT_140100 [Jimgerdemannia flammicorona]